MPERLRPRSMRSQPFTPRNSPGRTRSIRARIWNSALLFTARSAQGYLKTYEGEGNEVVLLADWTSLHLDLLARDRGLKRLAASLHEV
jgi:hypothetical protein